MCGILGISAFYHDSAAALVVNGEIIAAAQEERFTRKKHDASFPANAIRYCLAQASGEGSEIDHVVFYEKPFIKFERLIETYLSFAPCGFYSFCSAVPAWLSEKLFQKSIISRELARIGGRGDWHKKLLFTEHHHSHAASAFFPSPFTEALVLTVDGVGEWATTSAWAGRDNFLEILKELHFPHSLGLLYSAFTYYIGFKVNSGEYKLMGLAPYGVPRFAGVILDHLIDVKPDGSFRIDQRYFDYCTGVTMTNNSFDALFGGPPRQSEEPLTQRHMDLAASIQVVAEEVIIKLARALAAETGLRNLCLAGGVALNCVANGKLARAGIFDAIWVQPAAGDAGGALGAALAVWHQYLGEPRQVDAKRRDAMLGGYLGPSYSQADVESRLASVGAAFSVLSESELIEKTAEMLAAGQVIGWCQGRMEFGPRALGGRSILADPRSTTVQKTLNLKVKYRESFRPFAPSVLREDVTEWFETNADSPYMLMTAPVAQPRRRTIGEKEHHLLGIEKLNVPWSSIPAVTHVDYSARIQTVHADTNPLYHALIRRFKQLTSCPVVVNTSFNVRGEPIVCTPEDAFRCFMGTEIDVLVFGRCFMCKQDQKKAVRMDYESVFKLD
jgi:carbamoyltransferase